MPNIPKKYKKKVLIGVSVALVLWLLAWRGYINFELLIGSDLILTLSPMQTALNMYHGEIEQVQFTLEGKNKYVCDKSCYYEFFDKSNNTLLEKNFFSLKDEENKTLDFYIKAPEKGLGQKVYSLKIRCINVPSPTCITNSKIRTQTSLIFVNYLPTSEEVLLKQKIKSRLLQIFGKTISINNDAFKTDYLANVSNQQLLFEHMIDYSDFKNNLSYLNKIAKTAEVSWNLEDYTALNASFEYLSNKFLDEMQSSIKRDSTSIFSQISMYNEMISALEIIDGLNDTLNQTDIENFKEYLKNPRQMKNIDIEFWSLRARANIMFASLIDEGNILLKSEKEFLCLLKGACPPIQDYVIENNLKNNSQILAKICSEITALETAKNLSNYSIDNADAEKKQIILKNIQEYINNIKDTINSTAYLISPNLDTKCTFLTENFNLFQFGKNYLLDEITGNCQSPKGTNIGDFLSYPLSPESTDIYNFKDKYCGSFIKPTNLSAYKIPTIINSTPDFTLKLQELPPICCILGRCGICCSNCTKTYPIIFLHGHLFNKQNSPELALEIFSKMQEGLEKEGYINAGIILPNGENMSYGEWGLHGNPISVRATYYYAILNETGERIITLKSDKDISTYAERLNNIINVIKERTGKDKVILITHSMGGLVARKYIDKYGNNSISKLIMIAAPNQGISGTARDLCPLFGEQKECDDMTAGSEFILNLDPAVNGTYAYLISGVGCDTDGKDGDGVVKYTETKLENAREYEIRGKCNALDEIFHEEITNTDKYPEVYSIILKILKGDV